MAVLKQVARQVAIWAGELIAQAWMLGLLLSLCALLAAVQSEPRPFWEMATSMPQVLLVIALMILINFAVSFYAVTTLIARLIWTGEHLIAPSVVATCLYLLHLEFMLRSGGGLSFPWVLRIGGAFLVFGTSFFGTQMLRRDPRILAARTPAKEAANASRP